MAWKDLFINDENTSKDTTKKVDSKKETVTKFPTASVDNSQKSNFGFPQANKTESSGELSQEYATKFLDAYEKAFNDLNQTGYDFFEFFQSIIHGDMNNPQIYIMAFAMGKGMEKSITKESLLSQSDYYISELNKLYEKNVNDGNQKKQDLIKQKESETNNLTSELSSLKLQLEGIEVQIKDRESKLSSIDDKFQPKISDYDNKLTANDFAKNKVLSSIETVKQGINQNLK
jgi:hypothetical protein